MNDYYFWMIFHLLFVMLPVLSGAIVYKSLDRPMRFFWLFTFWELLTECMAYYFAFKIRNSTIVYTISGPIQLFLLTTYFESYVVSLKKYRAGVVIGTLGILVAIFNTLYLQPMGSFPGNFIFFQTIVSIFLALVGIRECIRLKQQGKKSFFPHFYLAAICLFGWLMLVTQLGLYSEMAKIFEDKNWIVDHFLQLANGVMGIYVTVIFLAFSKTNFHVRT